MLRNPSISLTEHQQEFEWFTAREHERTEMEC